MGKFKVGRRGGFFLDDLEFNQSFLENQYSYIQYYERLTDIGLNCFKWKNLPDTVDERFLELILFEQGRAVFFHDADMKSKEGAYLALQCMIGGKLNVYRIPLSRTAYATNGYNKQLTEKDSVIIFNNRIHRPSKIDVQAFAIRLYNLDRTIDVNVNGQKTPIAILCDENQRLTMKNLYMQYQGFQPFIFGGKDLDINAIKTIDTNTPYVSDQLYELKQKYWNEALTYLGIPNIGNSKKERMISNEVSSTMGGVYACRCSRLNARKQACEEINKMFGLNVDVEFNDEIIDGLDLSMPEDNGSEKEGEVKDE